MSVSNDVSRDVYALTEGRVSLGGFSTGSTGAEGIATQVYNFATQGARDEENNASYDFNKRMERTLAVLTCVGSTYDEKHEAYLFTKNDWGDDAHREYLKALNLTSDYDERTQKVFENASWQIWGGEKEGQSVNKYISDFSAEKLSRDQLNQLMLNGSCVYGEYRITTKADTAEISSSLQQIQNDRNREFRMFNTSSSDQARHSMQQLRSAQTRYMTDLATANGISNFSGSQKDIRELKSALNKEREKLIAEGAVAGENKRLDAINAQLKHIDMSEETGFGKDRHAAGMSNNRRAYGRRIIASSIMGNEMNQGVATYRQLYNLSRMGVKVAVRATIPVTKGISKVAGGVASIPGLKGTKAETGLGLMGNAANKAGDAAKDFGRHKSRGERRANRIARSDRRTARGNERFAKRSRNLESKISELEAKKEKIGLSKREQDRLDRNSRRRDRRTKTSERRILRQQKRTKRREFFGKISSIKNKIQNFLTKWNPVNAFARFVERVKRRAIIICGGVFLIIALLFIGMGGMAVIIPYVMNFISSPTEAKEVNFVQLIVNETASDLSAQFESVAKNDAQTHFLLDDPVASDGGIDWYKVVSEGEIRHIWASEDLNLPEAQRKELPGLSANLLPITSMMHYRYMDDLDYDQYNTAKAYEYYMFVRTHRVVSDADGNPSYSYETLDNHDASALYSTTPVYNVGSQLVTRGDELCENIYIHGYNNIAFGNDASVALAVNRARATMEGFLTKCVSSILGSAPQMDRKAEGIWLNEIPSDASGVCTNYMAYPAGFTDDCLRTADKGGSCPGYEHTHNGNCYKEVVGSQNEDGTPNMVQVLVCGLEEHHHVNWTSEYSPGCYDTVYLCKGHCGGHICPTIDIEMDMSWENIMKYDGFKTPYFLGSASFGSLTNWGNLKTIDAWSEKWMDRAGAWFSPIPDSPLSALQWFGRKLVFNPPVNSMPPGTSGDDDVYGFEGWWLPDGTIDEGLLSDLNSFYGTYETNYEDGVEAWKNFDVVFPVASGAKLTEAQIQSVLTQVKQSYPGISQRRLLVIEEALRGVGQYYYSLTGSAHMNAINSTSGAGECSGFVSGVLNRALGTNYNTSASGYYGYGSARMMTSGDVIATIQTSGHTIATGHVLIYVGFLPEGIPGYKITNKSGISKEQSGAATYVIDCTPTYGGSVFRQYQNFEGLHAWGGY